MESTYTIGRFGAYTDAGFGMPFVSTDPQKPDEIFKVYFKATNATVDDIRTSMQSIYANVSSSTNNTSNNNNNSSGGSNSSTFQLVIPRNYPYSDAPQNTSIF